MYNLTTAECIMGKGRKYWIRGISKLDTLAMRRKMHYDNRNNFNLMS